MKASVLKIDQRAKSYNQKNLGVQTIGEQNDYYQRLLEVVAASGTGKSCVDTFQKFVKGQGFVNESLNDIIITKKGETIAQLGQQTADDICSFNGFAWHFNYNANYTPTSITLIPFEQVRYKVLDEAGKFSQVAIHDDWGMRKTSLKKFRKEEIVFIDLYDSNPDTIQAQVDAAGGWEKYKGQVFVYSADGLGTYPIPVYDSVITDMSTEEGISNVLLRNVRNNFLPAGVFVNINSKSESTEQQDEFSDMIKTVMSDETACKVIVAEVDSKEDIPQFIEMSGKNLDKEFTFTDSTISEKIGSAFKQPPVLRAKDVGGNFGADAIKNAYSYYNAITVSERIILSQYMRKMIPLVNPNLSSETFEIEPLSYSISTNLAERIGDEGMKKIQELLLDKTILVEAKKSYAKQMFNLSDEEVNKLFL